MTFEEVSTKDALGLVLATPILQTSGRKILAKGRRLAADDVRLLLREGASSIWVVRLEADEVDEQEAVEQLAGALSAGPLSVEISVGGRANLVAREPITLAVDRERLSQVNGVGACMVATLPQWSVAAAGDLVATVKTRPFGVKRALWAASLHVLRHDGPVLRAHRFPSYRVNVIYCDPINPGRAEELLSPGVRFRATKLGLQLQTWAVPEQTEALSRGLRRALETRPQVIVVASTISPSCPEDAIGQAMIAAGAQIESFLSPVEPGMLLLLGYAGSTAIVSAPGCLRAKGPDVLDVILPPLLAGVKLSAMDIAALGVGGLLTPPRASLQGQ